MPAAASCQPENLETERQQKAGSALRSAIKAMPERTRTIFLSCARNSLCRTTVKMVERIGSAGICAHRPARSARRQTLAVRAWSAFRSWSRCAAGLRKGRCANAKSGQCQRRHSLGLFSSGHSRRSGASHPGRSGPCATRARCSKKRDCDRSRM